MNFKYRQPGGKLFLHGMHLLLASCALSAGVAGAAPASVISGDLLPITLSGDVLTLEQCIEIALQRHPSLAEARSSVESQTARVGQAAASLRPRVSVGPSYSYSRNDNSGERGNINTDFALSQTLFDWNRSDLSIQAARQERDARLWDEDDSAQEVVRDVMYAYYLLNRSTRTMVIASERVENYRSRLQWAQDFYSIGTKARIEVTKAQTDFANARLDFVTAQGATQRAVATLASAMGIPIATPDKVEDNLQYDRYLIAEDEAIITALQNRSDMKAQDVRVEAARTNLSLAKKGLAPTLTGNAGYTFYGEHDPVDNQDWRLSVGLSVPVFDGGLTREEIRQAEADLSGAEARRESLRQNVVLQVRTAHTSLMEAEESLTAALEVQRQARETLELAQGRYRAGVGESLEISDAVDGYAQAQMSVLTALFNHKAAEIELKRVMGVVFQ